jgi:clan AA aspartic protease (TIGR02281 family)
VNVRWLQILLMCVSFPAAYTFNSTSVDAQINYCVARQRQLTQAMNEHAPANILVLWERQYLSHCKDHMGAEEYAIELGMLALFLNDAKENQDALGVANRCLQINAEELVCLCQKADALFHLGRLSEAKSIIERSLKLGAITEIDASAKRGLQNLLSQTIDFAAFGIQVTAPNRNPSSRAEVSLKKNGGTFVVPVEINGAITLNFTIDSGAADVSVPADVFSTLRRAGTIEDADITGKQTYVLADGLKTQSPTFMIRSLKVGGRVIENVRGSVASAQGSLLLGQSFLEHFRSWSIDNTRHVLLLEPR